MMLKDRIVDLPNSPTPTELESSPLRPGQSLHRAYVMSEPVKGTTMDGGLSLEALQPTIVPPAKEPKPEGPESSQ